MAEKPGAYSTLGTHSGKGEAYLQSFIPKDPENELFRMPQIIIPIHVVPPEVSFVIWLEGASIGCA
jgi:hypothetical protein